MHYKTIRCYLYGDMEIYSVTCMRQMQRGTTSTFVMLQQEVRTVST